MFGFMRVDSESGTCCILVGTNINFRLRCIVIGFLFLIECKKKYSLYLDGLNL